MEACCQHKGADVSPLHLLGETPQPDNVYVSMRWSRLLAPGGWLSESPENIHASWHHKRCTAAVQSQMFTLKPIHADMYKLISFSLYHETTHLEQCGYHHNICRVVSCYPTLSCWLQIECATLIAEHWHPCYGVNQKEFHYKINSSVRLLLILEHDKVLG